MEGWAAVEARGGLLDYASMDRAELKKHAVNFGLVDKGSRFGAAKLRETLEQHSGQGITVHKEKTGEPPTETDPSVDLGDIELVHKILGKLLKRHGRG